MCLLAQDTFLGCKAQHVLRNDKKVDKLSTAEFGNLPREILLVPGKPYIITTKIDVIDGLVNGAVGMLKLCERGVSGQDTNEGEEDEGEEEAMEVDDEVEEAVAPTTVLPRRLWLQFDMPTTGKLTCLRSKQAVNEAKRNGYDVEST